MATCYCDHGSHISGYFWSEEHGGSHCDFWIKVVKKCAGRMSGSRTVIAVAAIKPWLFKGSRSYLGSGTVSWCFDSEIRRLTIDQVTTDCEVSHFSKFPIAGMYDFVISLLCDVNASNGWGAATSLWNAEASRMPVPFSEHLDAFILELSLHESAIWDWRIRIGQRNSTVWLTLINAILWGGIEANSSIHLDPVSLKGKA